MDLNMDRHDNLAAELAAVISVALARGWLEGHMHAEGNPYTVRIRGEYVLIGRGPGVEPRSERGGLMLFDGTWWVRDAVAP